MPFMKAEHGLFLGLNTLLVSEYIGIEEVPPLSQLGSIHVFQSRYKCVTCRYFLDSKGSNTSHMCYINLRSIANK